MKTLNEVIEAIEVCRNSYVAGKIIKSDALHYLKEYRDLKNALDAERVKTIEAYCQWQDAKEKLEAQTRQTMWVDKHFQFEISDNPPLTWDELKQMEGKPVWIEYNLDSKFDTVRNDSKIWGIIGNIQKVYYDRAYHNWLRMAIWVDETFLFAEEGLGTTWKAYRKERK